MSRVLVLGVALVACAGSGKLAVSIQCSGTLVSSGTTSCEGEQIGHGVYPAIEHVAIVGQPLDDNPGTTDQRIDAFTAENIGDPICDYSTELACTGPGHWCTFDVTHHADGACALRIHASYASYEGKTCYVLAVHAGTPAEQQAFNATVERCNN